eukprot:1263079-Pyramimonas_sp.AAC.1
MSVDTTLDSGIKSSSIDVAYVLIAPSCLTMRLLLVTRDGTSYRCVDVDLAGVERNHRLILLVWDLLAHLHGVRELDPRTD